MSSTTTCSICNSPSTIRVLGKLADSGIRMIAIHDKDNTRHEWVKYNSIYSIKHTQKKKPVSVVCPRCGDNGRVNTYRNQYNNIVYVVAHEKTGGKWGKGRNATTKHRRCYINKTEQQKVIKKILGNI